MEIDRVLLFPAQRRVQGRAGLGEAARGRGARLRWFTAGRHFSAVIDEAADGAR